jgi:hypothetical protein
VPSKEAAMILSEPPNCCLFSDRQERTEPGKRPHTAQALGCFVTQEKHENFDTK